jgi:alginate O-acetyltransferase complex protein AlgI
MVGWVFFRADTLTHALAVLAAMMGLGQAAPTLYTPGWYLTPAVLLALVAGAIGSAPLVPALARWRGRISEETRSGWLDVAATAAVLVLLAASILEVAAESYNPFIYFRF